MGRFDAYNFQLLVVVLFVVTIEFEELGNVHKMH